MLGALACSGRQRDFIDEEFTDIEDAIVPSGGNIASSWSRRDTTSRAATWRVTAPGHDWSTYTAWVVKQLPAYTRTDSAGSAESLHLRRSFAADSIHVEIRPESAQPLEITVIATAHPF